MLQFITHTIPGISYLRSGEIALEGGCRWIQLRMKEASDEEFITVGRRLRELTRSYDATFILDDRIHLVGALEADGVHLGKNDMPVNEGRRLLGPEKIIGATANTLEDAGRAVEAGADYLGIGPYRFTATKKNLAPILGPEGLSRIMTALRLKSSIPVVAIGGITEADLAQVMATGVTGVALSSVVLTSSDPVETTKYIVNKINSLNLNI